MSVDGGRGASKVLAVHVESVDAVLRLSLNATGGVQLEVVAERYHHLQMRAGTGGDVGSQCRLGGGATCARSRTVDKI